MQYAQCDQIFVPPRSGELCICVTRIIEMFNFFCRKLQYGNPGNFNLLYYETTKTIKKSGIRVNWKKTIIFETFISYTSFIVLFLLMFQNYTVMFYLTPHFVPQ